MPGLDEILAERIARLSSVPDHFLEVIEQAQRNLMRHLLYRMEALEMKGGRILMTGENIKEVDNIVNLMIKEDLMGGEYREGLKDFIRQFGVQGAISNAYFTKIVSNFSVKEVYEEALRAAQRMTLSAFSETGLYQPFTKVITEQLTNSVLMQETFTEAKNKIRLFIEGSDEVSGRLARYARGIAYDAYAVNDRSYSEIIAKDLGLDWYSYDGGIVGKTREFCEERDGQVWHREEVEAWGDLDWGGKMDGTNSSTIFQFLGGYNCRHVLAPISEAMVPEDRLKEFS